MKKWTVLLIFALIGLVACSKRSDRNNTVATNGVNTTGVNTNCLNTGTFNNQLYNDGTCGTNTTNNQHFQQYPVDQSHGFYQGYHNRFQSGFNSCPYGTMPTYSIYHGLNCISIQYIQAMQNLVYWQWNAAAFQFSFFGYGNHSTYGGNHYLPQTCETNIQCGVGACAGLGGGGVSLGLSIKFCQGGGGNGYGGDYGYDDYGYDYGY